MKTDVDALSRRKHAWLGEPVAARQRAFFDADEIEPAALSDRAAVGGAILSVDAAHPDQMTRGHHRQSVVGADLTREHSSRDDGTLAGECKHAVHGEAEQALIA